MSNPTPARSANPTRGKWPCILSKPDGSQTVIEVDLTDLKRVSDLIGGGWVEIVRIGMPSGRLYIDDEGIPKGFAVNVWATNLYQRGRGTNSRIYGAALFTDEANFQAAEAEMSRRAGGV